MLKSFTKLFKWGTTKSSDYKTNQTSLLYATLIGILEDVLFWKKMWLSLLFIFTLNIMFFICIHHQISFVKFVLSVSITSMVFDAFETWLKYKHRHNCLKRLAAHDGTRLNTVFIQMNHWLRSKWSDYLWLRETNHTKAFLLVNLIFTAIFFSGKYLNSNLMIYSFCMFVCVFYKIIPPLQRLLSNIQYDIESDNEFEGLIPKVSEVDISILSIEPEVTNLISDDKQAFESWKPEDMPIEEVSDSSENSSSVVTSFSINTINTLEKDVETSDSSEDEYIPLDQSPQSSQLKSTLNLLQQESSWSSSAYNAIWSLTGSVANIMNSDTNKKRKQRVSSIDSSDGFEIIDTKDL